MLALPRLVERHDPAGVLRFSFAPRDRGTAIRCDAMRRDATRRDAMRRVRPRAPRHFSKQYTTNTNQRTSHPVRVLALSAFSRHRRAPLRDSNSVSPPFPFPLSSNSLSLSLCPLLPTFLSSSQRRFFRTHTPPRINNSPYEFTRSGRAATRASERVSERTSGLVDRRLGGAERAARVSVTAPPLARRQQGNAHAAHTTHPGTHHRRVTTARGELP